MVSNSRFCRCSLHFKFYSNVNTELSVNELRQIILSFNKHETVPDECREKVIIILQILSENEGVRNKSCADEKTELSLRRA